MTKTLSDSPLIETITSEDDAIRNRSLDQLCEHATLPQLLEHAKQLDAYWRGAENLYHRVRALFFLAGIYQHEIPPHLAKDAPGLIPFDSYRNLLERRFVETIDSLLLTQADKGPSDGLASALAHAYHELAFQTLADQVRKSVRTVKGNQWMFRTGHPDDHPLRLRSELLQRPDDMPLYPVLKEPPPSAWIFRTAAGATSFSWAWTIPLVPASSTHPLT